MDVGPNPGYGPPDPVRVEPAYPVKLRGRLDEPLVPFLWLVKWLLALPH